METNIWMPTRLLSTSVIKNSNHTKTKYWSWLRRESKTTRKRQTSLPKRDLSSSPQSWRERSEIDFTFSFWRKTTTLILLLYNLLRSLLGLKAQFFMELRSGLTVWWMLTPLPTHSCRTTSNGCLKLLTGTDSTPQLLLVSSIVEIRRMLFKFWTHISTGLLSSLFLHIHALVLTSHMDSSTKTNAPRSSSTTSLMATGTLGSKSQSCMESVSDLVS